MASIVISVVVSIVTGLLVNEFCEISPWCAHRLVRWAAFRRYADRGRAEMRAEEWLALINDRPGKLFKLITALSFAGAAAVDSGRRVIARSGRSRMSHQEALDRLYPYLDKQVPEVEAERIRLHLDECGLCLRELGLEEAVKRLVAKHCGSGDPELRSKVMVRIGQVRSEVDPT